MTIKRSIAKGNPKTFKFIFVLKPPKFLLKNFGVQENRSIRKFYEFSNALIFFNFDLRMINYLSLP